MAFYLVHGSFHVLLTVKCREIKISHEIKVLNDPQVYDLGVGSTTGIQILGMRSGTN